jgi:hypothetical protein
MNLSLRPDAISEVADITEEEVDSLKKVEIGGPCYALGTRIFETETTKSIIRASFALNIVTGYYGYGKTIGVGGYVICKARNENNFYLYVNLRELKSTTQLETEPLSLRDVLKSVVVTLVDKKYPVEILVRNNIFDTNIPEIQERLAKIVDEINNREIPLGSIISKFLPEILEKRLYIIIDELEQVAPDLSGAFTNICNEAKQLDTALKDRIRIYLLLQEAMVVQSLPGFLEGKLPCESSSAGQGIATFKPLRGYTAKDYVKIMRQIGIKGNDEALKKIAKKLEKLPPRLVFSIFYDAKTVDDVEDALNSLKDVAEGLILYQRNKMTRKSIENFLDRLKKNLEEATNITIIETKELLGDVRRNVYVHELKFQVRCTKRHENVKEITVKLCIDFRESRPRKSNLEVLGDCQIRIERDEDGKLMIDGKPLDIDFRLMLAAYSDLRPHMVGLKTLYEEVRMVTSKYLSNYLWSRLFRRFCE